MPGLALLANPLVRNLLVYATIALACWMGWRYVQDLRQTAADQAQQITQLNARLVNLDEVNKAKDKAHADEVAAQQAFQAQTMKALGELKGWNARHAVSIPEMVQTDPKKAEQSLFDEFKYRLKCIELITGKQPAPEELAAVKNYCEQAQ